MRETRIRKYAGVFMIILGIYSFYYPFATIIGLLDFTFLDPQRMESSRFTSGHVNELIRWIYFIMWLLPVVAGVYACAAALFSVNLCRNGHYFDTRFARGIWHVGMGTIISLATDIIATTLSPKVLSGLNPNGPLALRFRFNSEEYGLLLCGIGFCALGWVIHEAVKIAEENDGFI